MTADALQSLVLRLANVAPTRYWLHYNHPYNVPWLMAVRVYPTNGRPETGGDECPIRRGLIAEGFVQDGPIFLIDRTDDDGMPYRGEGTAR